MDDFERRLRAGFEESRSSYEEAPDPFVRIARSAKRRLNRRRARAAITGACVAALIGVPIAVAELGDSSDPSPDAALTWSARPHEGSGTSHVVTGPGQRSVEGDGGGVKPRPKGASDGTSLGVAPPGGTRSTVPGTPGSDPVTNPPSADVTPNPVAPGGTTDGTTTGDGTSGGGTPAGGTSGGGTSGGGETDGGKTDGTPPDASELQRLSPSTGTGETSANLAGAPACGGPSALDVGEVGVFTAPGRSAEPFPWAPSEPGAFDVVLDGPAGVVCASAVTVVDVVLGSGAAGDLTPP